MHRASETVSKLATALSKAQIELTNPPKSMIGTVPGNSRDNPPQSFRYASLSSGLEIVRKTLGNHEVALIQTTDIDRAAGAVSLTTTLMHASGEWIASDWPVCSLTDIAMPRRMGAALTYARRYALFTLVGIAGEDDLDSLSDAAETPTPAALNHAPISHDKLSPAASAVPNQQQHPAREALSSADQRNDILAEIEAVSSLEEIDYKAPKLLKAKNALTNQEARDVEAAFQAKLNALAGPTAEFENQSGPTAPTKPCVNRKRKPARKAKTAEKKETALLFSSAPTAIDDVASAVPAKIDKSILAIAEPRRLRDKNHLKFVASQPCLICGRTPADAHHLRFAQPRALGRKTSDEFTVPLCRAHHRENHRTGKEQDWWKERQIDPIQAAALLWGGSRAPSS